MATHENPVPDLAVGAFLIDLLYWFSAFAKMTRGVIIKYRCD